MGTASCIKLCCEENNIPSGHRIIVLYFCWQHDPPLSLIIVGELVILKETSVAMWRAHREHWVRGRGSLSFFCLRSLGLGWVKKHACHVLLAAFAIEQEVCKKQEIVACVIPCDPVLFRFFSIKLYSRVAYVTAQPTQREIPGSNLDCAKQYRATLKINN